MNETTTDPSTVSARRAYGLAELAESIGCSSAFLRLEATRGRLRTVRLGRRRLVLAEDFERYLQEGRSNA